MDKLLQPGRFDADQCSSGASKARIHWRHTFKNLLTILTGKDLNKFGVLTNFISPPILRYLKECTSYESAIETPQNIYVKPMNKIYTRHVLATPQHETGEKLDEYLQAFRALSKECNFQSITTAKYSKDYIQDAFITGLHSNQI